MRWSKHQLNAQRGSSPHYTCAQLTLQTHPERQAASLLLKVCTLVQLVHQDNDPIWTLLEAAAQTANTTLLHVCPRGRLASQALDWRLTQECV